jgi:RNA polymerase sigma-70 factor (ECF subfamily)
MDEQNLIDAAIKGDLDSFNRLVLEYQDLAYNVAYRMLGDELQTFKIVSWRFI